MNPQQIIKELEQSGSDRESKTIYLSKSLVAEAEKKARGISISRLIERLLRDFVSSAKGGKS